MAHRHYGNHRTCRLWVAITVCCLTGCGAHIPLSERHPKPEERFAYSVNLMPNSPAKRLLLMKYDLFLQRTRLLDTKHERRYVARLDAVADSGALNAFWLDHFADRDPYPTTPQNEWFDDLAIAAQVADSTLFRCFHYLEPDPRGAMKDPDDMLDDLGGVIARLGPMIHWEAAILGPDENIPLKAGVFPFILDCTFLGNELNYRRFVRNDYDHWIEIPVSENQENNGIHKGMSGQNLAAYARIAMISARAISATKFADSYPFKRLEPGDAVVDVIPVPDGSRHRYSARMNWKINPRAIAIDDDPAILGFRYHYTISAPDGTLLHDGVQQVVDTLADTPADGDALYFRVASPSFFTMGDPPGGTDGKYRVGIDFSNLREPADTRSHTPYVEYFTMLVDGVVPTERAWVVNARGIPDVYNRMKQGVNHLAFPCHFISNDSLVTQPEKNPATGFYECRAELEFVRTGGGVGYADEPDEAFLIYLPWDNRMTALDSIITESERTGVVPQFYMARVPRDSSGSEYEWRRLAVPGRIRKFLENELFAWDDSDQGRAAFRVETFFSVPEPNATIVIPVPISKVGRPRPGGSRTETIAPGEYYLTGNIWPTGDAVRYSPYTTKPNSVRIPYQRIKVRVTVQKGTARQRIASGSSGDTGP